MQISKRKIVVGSIILIMLVLIGTLIFQQKKLILINLS